VHSPTAATAMNSSHNSNHNSNIINVQLLYLSSGSGAPNSNCNKIFKRTALDILLRFETTTFKNATELVGHEVLQP